MNTSKEDRNAPSRRSKASKEKKREDNGRHKTNPPYPLPQKDKEHEIGKGEDKPEGDEIHGIPDKD